MTKIKTSKYKVFRTLGIKLWKNAKTNVKFLRRFTILELINFVLREKRKSRKVYNHFLNKEKKLHMARKLLLKRLKKKIRLNLFLIGSQMLLLKKLQQALRRKYKYYSRQRGYLIKAQYLLLKKNRRNVGLLLSKKKYITRLILNALRKKRYFLKKWIHVLRRLKKKQKKIYRFLRRKHRSLFFRFKKKFYYIRAISKRKRDMVHHLINVVLPEEELNIYKKQRLLNLLSRQKYLSEKLKNEVWKILTPRKRKTSSLSPFSRQLRTRKILKYYYRFATTHAYYTYLRKINQKFTSLYDYVYWLNCRVPNVLANLYFPFDVHTRNLDQILKHSHVKINGVSISKDYFVQIGDLIEMEESMVKQLQANRSIQIRININLFFFYLSHIVRNSFLRRAKMTVLKRKLLYIFKKHYSFIQYAENTSLFRKECLYYQSLARTLGMGFYKTRKKSAFFWYKSINLIDLLKKRMTNTVSLSFYSSDGSAVVFSTNSFLSSNENAYNLLSDKKKHNSFYFKKLNTLLPGRY